MLKKKKREAKTDFTDIPGNLRQAEDEDVSSERAEEVEDTKWQKSVWGQYG